VGGYEFNNQCLPDGYHGWHHSTERGRTTVRDPTPVNWYGGPCADPLRAGGTTSRWVTDQVPQTPGDRSRRN